MLDVARRPRTSTPCATTRPATTAAVHRQTVAQGGTATRTSSAPATDTRSLRRPTDTSAAETRTIRAHDPSAQIHAMRARQMTPVRGTPVQGPVAQGPSKGEEAARKGVEVDEQSVKDERAALERRSTELAGEARTKADALFRANPASGDRVEVTKRDAQGRVVEREVATRRGDEVSYSHTAWENGVATRRTVSTGAGGTTERAETWKEAASKSPSNPSGADVEARAARGEKEAHVVQHGFRTDDGKLVNTQLTAGPEGRVEVERKFGTQKGKDHIHGDVGHDFSDDRETTVVESKTKVTRPGKDTEEMKSTAYSQGNLRATSFEQEDKPKSWVLEKQTGNEYAAQTFVEGHTDVTSIVRRRAEGSRLTETIETKGPKDEDRSTTRNVTDYDAKGQVNRKFSFFIDDAGRQREQLYQRSERATAQGTEVSEKVTASVQDPKNGKTQLESEQVTLENGDKRTLLSSSEQITAADGTSAKAIIDGSGTRVIVNGKEVPQKDGKPDLSTLPPSAKDLAGQALADRITSIKDYADLTAKGGQALSIVSKPGAPAGSIDTGRGSLNARLEQMNQDLRAQLGDAAVDAKFAAQRTALSGAGAALGVAGVVASGLSFYGDIRDKNYVKAAVDAAGVAGSGVVVASAAQELAAISRGGAAGAAGASATVLGRIAGPVGLGVGVAASGYQLIDGISKGNSSAIQQGAVGVVGTIGAFAAAGAIGGPVGALVGVGIGALTFGVQKLIGYFHRHDVADREI